MREYEILVAGSIGPGAAAGLPGFTAVTTPATTLITGTAADTEALRTLLSLLRARGLTATCQQLEPHGQS